MKYTIIR